jgi:micrococcal nuclease
MGLLNAGPFSVVEYGSRDTDKYGRKLRDLTRGGKSLGSVLVSEGLAERWTGHRRDWCH